MPAELDTNLERKAHVKPGEILCTVYMYILLYALCIDWIGRVLYMNKSSIYVCFIQHNDTALNTCSKYTHNTKGVTASYAESNSNHTQLTVSVEPIGSNNLQHK